MSYIPALNLYAMLSGLGDTLSENSDRARARQQQELENAALRRFSGDESMVPAPQQGGNVFGNILSGVQKTLSPPAAAAPGLQPAPTTPPPNMAGGAPDVEAYIRQAAAQRGIDPEIALKVARSEGLNSYTGDQGSSFGPFQLHYGGVAQGGNRVAGMGDDFTKATGLDARDPKTVNAQIDFALDHAAKKGWGPFHGAANSGIAPMQGIGQGGRVQLAGPVPTPDSAAPAQPQAAPAAGGDYQVNGRKYTMQDALIFAQSRNPGTAALGKAMLGKIMEGKQGTVTNVTDPAERASLGLAPDDRRLVQRSGTGQISIVDTAPKEVKRTAESDVAEREKIANQRGLQGADRDFYILNGKLPTSGEKALTEGQANAGLYADRMREAENILSNPEYLNDVTVVNKGLGSIPVFGTRLASTNYQLFEQAKENFLTAVLRRESGATITPPEWERGEKQYFPQPGNPPELIAQKAKTRATALQGIANAGGAAYAKKHQEPAQEDKPVPEKQSVPQPKLGSVPIPMGAAGYLKENPNLRDAFDLKYGAGAADKVLGPAR